MIKYYRSGESFLPRGLNLILSISVMLMALLLRQITTTINNQELYAEFIANAKNAAAKDALKGFVDPGLKVMYFRRTKGSSSPGEVLLNTKTFLDKHSTLLNKCESWRNLN